MSGLQKESSKSPLRLSVPTKHGDSQVGGHGQS